MSADAAPPLSAQLIRPGRPPTGFAAAATLVTVEAQDRPLGTITGEPLPRGSVLELGYFRDATIHDLFAGAWRPLIGLDAPKANRSISPIFSGQGGEPDGLFSWCRTFFAGIDALPPVGRPLALRLHDHPNTADAFFYNTVSHPSWWFREPRSPSPAFVFMSLDDTGLRWESGPDGAYRTVLRTGAGGRRPSAAWRRALALLGHKRRV
jgi:hypothetical protein